MDVSNASGHFMFTFQALQVLIFLIPGFITSSLLNTLIVRKEKSDLIRITEALVFTLIIFTIYSVLVQKSPIEFKQIGNTITYGYNSSSFFLLIGISVIMAIILSIFNVYDFHMKIARKIKITKKTSRTSVWVDVFYDMDNYIIINFKDERRICGWPLYFSNNPNEPFIFLEDASWIDEKGKFMPLEIEGILITPEMKIESIEVLKDVKVNQ